MYDKEVVVVGLATWQQHWKSDTDSIEVDPLIYDPAQWRLVSPNPDHDCKGFGADVDRVARTAAPPRP
jgi:hypothetical protein